MWKRALLFAVVLVCAGCYQQASDNFETINSSSDLSTQAGSMPGMESTPVVIVPDGGSTPAPGELVQLQVTGSGEAVQPSDSATAIPNAALGGDLTPTVIIIIPVDNTSTPSLPDPGSLLPTATPPMLITPQSPSQLTLATATTIGQAAVANPPTNGIQTPTQLPSPTSEACTYIISSGDTLFRIALNNDVSLAELLSLNGLAESSIIQPGQTLQLPNCTDGQTNPSLGVTQAVVDGNSAPATLETGGSGGNPGIVASQAIHTVASGETLYGIALRYGVTVNAIVQANNLANPDRLNLGQQLVIPQ
jgi:LysM repeat protein